jgi:hypothetical protein
MKVITYGIQPKPKPPPNFPEMLADHIMSRHGGWVLAEAVKIIARRLVGSDVPQAESSAPAAVIQPISEEVDLIPIGVKPKRRPGRPKGTRKRRWSEERKQAHRLRKERRLEEIRANPRAQALMATLSGMAGARQDGNNPLKQIDATSQPSNVA